MKVELSRDELLEIYKALGIKVDTLNGEGKHNEANELWRLAEKVYEYNREAKYMDAIRDELGKEEYERIVGDD